MANVLDLRRRIRSVKNTRQITKAMKMVSAARLRRAQERALSARPYAKMIASVLNSLKRRIEVYDPISGDLRHPLLLTRPEKNILLIVIAGDKGFAGAFNSNITKASLAFLAEHPDVNIDIESVGRRARDLFRRRYPAASYTEQTEGEEETAIQARSRSERVEVTGEHPTLLARTEFTEIDKLTREIISRYAHEEIDACYVVYNEFKSVIQQRLVVEKLLPILEIGSQQIAKAEEMTQEEKERAAEAASASGVSVAAADTRDADEEAARFGTADVDYIYEQKPSELFAALLPQYLSAMLYHAVTESVAAEHAARMTAMDAATNNASEMIDSLTLNMNRVRQAAITKEIIEIVSGAAAL